MKSTFLNVVIFFINNVIIINQLNFGGTIPPHKRIKNLPVCSYTGRQVNYSGRFKLPKKLLSDFRFFLETEFKQ
ncbi:hypothetical protein D9M68_535080 [compost metagenome]